MWFKSAGGSEIYILTQFPSKGDWYFAITFTRIKAQINLAKIQDYDEIPAPTFPSDPFMFLEVNKKLIGLVFTNFIGFKNPDDAVTAID
jgi:hypothetical protein